MLIIRHVVSAADGSQYESKSAVGTCSSDLDWSVSFGEYTSILEAELLATALAMKRIPSSVLYVIFITDLLFRLQFLCQI